MSQPEGGKRETIFGVKVESLLRNALSVAIGAALAFATTGVIILANGKNPLTAFEGIAQGAFGNPFFFALTLDQMVPILLTALSAIIIFAAQIWNIGQEGQLYIGALFSTWVAISLSGAPTIVVLPAALVAGAIGGMVWSGISGVLYAYFGTDAVISSIMLNYISMFVVHLAVLGPPLGDPNSGGNAISLPVPVASRLPIIFPGTFLNAGFLIAMIMPFVVYIILTRTTLGYRIRAMGYSPSAARYAGIKSRPTVLAVFLLSGALSGLAGGIVLLGLQLRLQVGLSPGYGTMGVISSLLGFRSPIGAIFGSLFTAALLNGTENAAITSGISTFLVSVLQGITIIVVFALSSDKLRLFKRRK